MYGWIHNCFKEATINLCGEEKWQEICAKAGVESTGNSGKTSYILDSQHFALVSAALELLPHISEQELYDIYGNYFISYLQKNGYEAYLLTFGDTLYELLNNMNKLHSHLATSMDKMKIPIIQCKKCDERDTFLLYYSSPRGTRLACLLVGLVKSVARTYFSTEVTLHELARQGDASDSSCTVWKVVESRIRSASRASSASSACSSVPSLRDRGKLDSTHSILANQFHLLSPCHIIFNSDFEIVQISDNMTHSESSRHRLSLVGSNLMMNFRISAPGIDGISGMDWDTFHTAVLVTSDNQQLFCFETVNEFTKSGKPYSYVGNILFLKNSMSIEQAAVFLCSPHVETLEDMYDQGVSIKDLKNKDECRMQMLLNQANVKHFQESSTEANEKLNEELLTSEKVKRDLDAKRRLMMYISHEIRTPLSVVNFGFQLIKSQLDKLEGLVQDNDINSHAIHSDNDVDVDGGSSVALSDEKRAAIRNTIDELNSITSDSAHSVEVAISILNDFLNYEKLQTNVLEMFQDFVPCSHIQTIVDEFQVEANYFKVKLSFKNAISFEERGKLFMYADKQKISQVLRNFVSNALKFTPESGSVTVTMSFEPYETDKEQAVKTSKEGVSFVECGNMHVSILDTGAGIAKENKDKVFNEMVQFSPNELQAGGGSGLGLYITRAIVNKHNGTVGFESEGLGHGCNFFFNMPVYWQIKTEVVPCKSEDSQSPPTLPGPCASLKSSLVDRTVLICDDSNLSRKMLRKILIEMGCKHCYEAKNGLEAVKLTEDRQNVAISSSSYNVIPAFDLILLDDHMPVMEGPEAARLIRDLGFTNPIIGVTGNLASEEVDHFMASGVDAVLSKPLEISKLLKILRQYDNAIVID